MSTGIKTGASLGRKWLILRKDVLAGPGVGAHALSVSREMVCVGRWGAQPKI